MVRKGIAPMVIALGLVASGPARAERIHVVQPGETLWQIAALATGDPHHWQQLYRANRDQIKDPARLYPGQKLSIPELGGPPVGAAPPPNGSKPPAD